MITPAVYRGLASQVKKPRQQSESKFRPRASRMSQESQDAFRQQREGGHRIEGQSDESRWSRDEGRSAYKRPPQPTRRIPIEMTDRMVELAEAISERTQLDFGKLLSQVLNNALHAYANKLNVKLNRKKYTPEFTTEERTFRQDRRERSRESGEREERGYRGRPEGRGQRERRRESGEREERGYRGRPEGRGQRERSGESGEREERGFRGRPEGRKKFGGSGNRQGGRGGKFGRSQSGGGYGGTRKPQGRFKRGTSKKSQGGDS